MRKKIYASYNTLTREFFITGEYARVEHYDHIELYEDELQGRHRGDFWQFGFAVACPDRFGTDNIYLENMWRTRYIVPAKPGKTLQQMKDEAYEMAGYVKDEDGEWRLPSVMATERG